MHDMVRSGSQYKPTTLPHTGTVPVVGFLGFGLLTCGESGFLHTHPRANTYAQSPYNSTSSRDTHTTCQSCEEANDHLPYIPGTIYAVCSTIVACG